MATKKAIATTTTEEPKVAAKKTTKKATTSNKKVVFTLPTEAFPTANSVALLGDFNAWNIEQGIELKKTKELWKATVELETGREYQFRYLINGNIWENAWNAEKYVSTPFGVDNSVVTA